MPVVGLAAAEEEAPSSEALGVGDRLGVTSVGMSVSASPLVAGHDVDAEIVAGSAGPRRPPRRTRSPPWRPGARPRPARPAHTPLRRRESRPSGGAAAARRRTRRGRARQPRVEHPEQRRVVEQHQPHARGTRPRSSGIVRPASPSTTPSSGRTAAPPMPARRCATHGHESAVTRQDRPGARSVFLRHQDRLAARQRAEARGRKAEQGAARLRYRRLVPALAAHRRRGARHRRHQRGAHAALRHPHAAHGTTTSRGSFRVPTSLLPQVRDCAAEFGETLPELFGGPIRVLGIAGDQQAATVGQGCFTPGMMKSTYGTGCFALLNTGAEPIRSRNRLLTTIAYQLDGRRTYALEGAIFIAGARGAVAARRPALHQAGVRRERAGATSRSGRAGLSGAGLRRARRALLGPGCAWRAHGPHAANPGPAEIAQAALESVGYQTRDLLEAMLQRLAGRRQHGAARRRRHDGERRHHAVSRRHPRRRGRPAGGDGDDGAWAPLIWPASRPACAPIRQAFQRPGGSTGASSRPWTEPPAPANGPAGRTRSAARSHAAALTRPCTRAKTFPTSLTRIQSEDDPIG